MDKNVIHMIKMGVFFSISLSELRYDKLIHILVNIQAIANNENKSVEIKKNFLLFCEI